MSGAIGLHSFLGLAPTGPWQKGRMNETIQAGNGGIVGSEFPGRVKTPGLSVGQIVKKRLKQNGP